MRRASPTRAWIENHDSDKRSILLDLNNPRGLALARRLVAISDIVLTNFSPRAIAKWDLTYESLKTIKPDVILMHVPAMGMTGPKREYAGFGSSFKALGGLNMLMGFEGTDPVGPQGTFTDWCLVPSHVATALLAALHHRQRTGEGQFIELAQYECIINATGSAILEYTANGRRPPRTGNRHPAMAPHGHFPCKGEERWVAIAARTQEEWEALCAVANKPEWLADPRFATPAARLLHHFFFNTSKRAITLDIEHLDGRDILRQLAARADVLVETFPVGYLGGLGLGYAALAEMNPRLIMTSSTPFGQVGPYRDFKGPNIVADALGGLMYVTGSPDGPPLMSGPNQACYLAGEQAAVATLIALYHRDLTGEGQYVDVSMHEAVALTVQPQSMFWPGRGEVPKRFGYGQRTSTAAAVASSFYRCKDGWVTGLGTQGRTWPEMVAWLQSAGAEDDLEDPKYDDAQERIRSAARVPCSIRPPVPTSAAGWSG